MQSILLVEGEYDHKLIQKICESAQLSLPMLFEIAGQGGVVRPIGGLELGHDALISSGSIWSRPGERKFACWIKPDNQQSGALEGRLPDCMASEQQQLLRTQARRFVDFVEPRLFPDTEAARQKATLRAWFAVQEEAIWLPSFAVGDRLLLPRLEEDDAFVGWLRELEHIASSPLA